MIHTIHKEEKALHTFKDPPEENVVELIVLVNEFFVTESTFPYLGKGKQPFRRSSSAYFPRTFLHLSSNDVKASFESFVSSKMITLEHE